MYLNKIKSHYKVCGHKTKPPLLKFHDDGNKIRSLKFMSLLYGDLEWKTDVNYE